MKRAPFCQRAGRELQDAVGCKVDARHRRDAMSSAVTDVLPFECKETPLGIVIAIRGVVKVMQLSFMSSVSMADRAALETGRLSGSDSQEASRGFEERRRSVDGPGRDGQ